MPSKLTIWNQRMITLMEQCIEKKLVQTQKEFLDSIDARPTILAHIRTGNQSFTVKHLFNAAKKYNINVNWLFGFDNRIERNEGKSALQNLKEAIRAFEIEIKK